MADTTRAPSQQRPAATATTPIVSVALKEAALDSPTFRATASHFIEQVEAVDKWLTGYVTSSAKLFHETQTLEEAINNYVSKITPSPADGVIDNDYTFSALKHIADGSREYWQQMLASTKRMDFSVVEPIRSFLASDMKNFKEIRRSLEQTQRTFDSSLSRYVGQSKTKEPSSLREDAFTVYENRKAYIMASMDFCQLAPQLLFTADKLLVKVSSEVGKEMKRSRDALTNATKWGNEMDRIKGWAREMENSEMIFRRELHNMRKELGETAMENSKPSRELEEYSRSTVQALGSRGPMNLSAKDSAADAVSEKQGWLFQRIVTGKPARHSWVRRWFFVREGVFGWLVAAPHGVLQGDEIGVLLCNAKPAVNEERRFCFEVKTNIQTILLQAETQKELMGWLEVFEVMKKKAFETSMNRDNSPLKGSTTDPAFSISPPIPEFSAKQLDATMNNDESAPALDRSATLAPPGEGHLASRQSFDPSGSIGRRSITALGRDLAREDGESGREHAVRIISTLRENRKATFSSGEASPGLPSSGSGGIAGLIAASHVLMPVQASAAMGTSALRQNQMLPSVDSHPGALAPLTLAKPPAATHLSRFAVVNSGERGTVSDRTKLPQSLMANYWGSQVWATVQVTEEPLLPRHDDDDPIGVVMSDNAKTPLSTNTGGHKVEEAFPLNYPPELKAQHQQFRLLFPNVPTEEKLVLVVRAMWSTSLKMESGKQQRIMGDGRIYVTPDNMLFYGQQLGLVTAFSISLDSISELTATAGREADQIVLHRGQEDERIAIKIFLDDVGLLRSRLNLLLDNLQAEEPMDTSELVRALISVSADDEEKRSPSAESWEEVSANTPMDDGTPGGRPVRKGLGLLERSPLTNSPQKFKLRVPPKLQLPTHPVVYEPEDMPEAVVDRHFEISAKACFHVLFGDKSFVFPKLYFERRANQIAQGPWTLIDQGQMQREFQFKVNHPDMLGRAKTTEVRDLQTIEVYSDHITYVVAHTKTAWHLPHSEKFKTVTKIVITHMAKSKCKLAIYVRVDWSKAPALSRNMVERQSLRDAESDAEELADLLTDQIRKLGVRSRTNRAIQVYGHVGQQSQVVVFSPAVTKDSKKKQAVKPRTLTAMLFETMRSFAESAISSVIMWGIAGLRRVFRIVSAQRLLLLVLGISALFNMYLSSMETAGWWTERRAASYMKRLGVGPNMQMSRAVYIADLDEATNVSDGPGGRFTFPQNSTCYSTFKSLLATTDEDAPWDDAGSMLSSPSSQSTARRLRRTRQRLGSYRYDLLVAMRVVNSIELEAMHSEWENWLLNEKTLCDDLSHILNKDGGKLLSGDIDEVSQKTLGGLPKDRKKLLELWRDEHCGSCGQDYKALKEHRSQGPWV